MSDLLNEMDKSQKGAPGWNISDDEPGGKEHYGKSVTAKKFTKDAGKALDKAFNDIPKSVKDRKTGKMYDPDKEFDKKMNSPEVMAQMKRMAQKEGVAENRYGSRDAYQRDYDSSQTGFGRGHDHRGLGQELAHETNNYAVAIDGKRWKVFASKSHADAVARSLQAKGKNATVHETGASVSESATAGATSAANVGVGAVYANKPPKQPKNKDGTAKNALDINANLMTGGSIKRR